MSTITLMESVTADQTSPDWKLVKTPGEYRIEIDGSADLGGGTLAIETASEVKTASATPSDQSVTSVSNLAGKVISLGAGMHVRATLTSSTSPDISYIRLHRVTDNA